MASKSNAIRGNNENVLPSIALLVGSLLFAGGCRDSPYDLAPVTGTVTLDGKPFLWGSVMFAPMNNSTQQAESGKPAFGMLDAEGRYELGTYADGDGAVVGPHRVTVFHVEDGPNGPAPSGVPPFLRMALRGEALTVVAGQDNHFDIELSSEMLRKHGSSR